MPGAAGSGNWPPRAEVFAAADSPPTRLTVASLLKQHGYHTACRSASAPRDELRGRQAGTQSKVPVVRRLTHGPMLLGFDYFYGVTH